MKNICKLCGTHLDGTEDVCPLCGTPLDDDVSLEPEIQPSVTSKKRRRKLVPILIVIIAIIIGGSLGHLGYNYISEQEAKKEEAAEEQALKDAAQTVVNLIDSIEDQDDSTIDELLREIQLAYNSLSKEEKSYVSNYSVYKDAYDKNVAKKFDQKVVSVSITTYEETSKLINSLKEEYNNMTESQHNYVTSLHHIDTYQERLEEVKEEEAEQSQREAQAQEEQKAIDGLWDLVRNFKEFNGKWGDFGAHINSYQGQIESAIKASINLSDYFQGAPNDLKMRADSFTYTYGGEIESAWTYISFEGTLRSGEAGWLSGQIVIEGGKVIFTEVFTSEELQ